MKEIVLVGGPNGAGKTTFIESFLDHYQFEYLGADKIAYDLCPDDVESVAIQAGREFIKRVRSCCDNGDNVIVESTLSGVSLAKHIKRFRDRGYLVRVIFISIPNAKVSAQRVELRVSKGGHKVPIEDIERRYLRTYQNFWHVYRPLADRWFIYSNQNNNHQLKAFGDSKCYDMFDKPFMQDFLWKLKD